jgi:hypothetical protein
MRKALPYLLVAIVAIALVIAPRLVVYGTDDFTFTRDNHKAFVYGFPFRITDCPSSPAHTSASEASLRLLGNFLVFFGAGITFVLAVSRVSPQTTHTPAAS